MNPAPRDGSWPQAASGHGAQAGPGQSIRQTTPGSNNVLPPPSSNFYSNQPGHNLSSLSGKAQGQQAPQELPPQHQLPPVEPAPAQGVGGYSLPALSQAVASQPPAPPRPEQEPRDVDMAVGEEITKREPDSQGQEEQAAQTHSANVMIQQPLPLPPNIRSIHAPDGLLGNPGPMLGPGGLGNSLGPNAPLANVFGGTVAQNGAQPPPQSASQLLMPVGAGNQQGPMAINQAGQQPILNDALSYLDQVKVQFSDRPDVYNQFLDIMKDFKSGAIDTPGVIDRVSSLFAGNPGLIQGFNTFLPPGYKIECGVGDDTNTIRVTTPLGTEIRQMQMAPHPRPPPPRENDINGNNQGYHEGARAGPNNWQQGIPAGEAYNADGRPPPFGTHGPAPISPEAQASQPPPPAHLGPQHEQRPLSQVPNPIPTAPGAVRSGVLSPSEIAGAQLPNQAVNGMALKQAGAQNIPAEKRGPVEFNHAISYVNKIKNRFAQQPDIYKQFLEILQTYQRESKPIQDVYAQVTKLFESAPDLLEDFKQFLPESAAHAKAQQQRLMNQEYVMSDMRHDGNFTPAAQAPMNPIQPAATPARLPPLGTFSSTPTASRDTKRKRPRDVPQSVRESVPAPVEVSSVRAPANGKRPKHQPLVGKVSDQPVQAPISPTIVPSLPQPIPPQTYNSAMPDELALFDRAKKHINNKNTYSEFLKLCNLFNQQLINKEMLIHRSYSFLGGNPELFNNFKQFLGGDSAVEETITIKPKQSNGRVSLSKCRSLHSYRLLPRRETQAVCSGRDALCKSVLNDDWASHPTWASEDSGFVAHRKNQHEEGLHRIEEERHDYDFNIEALMRTIQLLEPIAQQLKAKSMEERHLMKVPDRLGGQSDTIYKRVVMKIYGREKGQTVIRNLFDTPWEVIPVLLGRLKGKLEEWKAAQREWEKVWRDQTQKIFWKSLDHQGISQKASDKRQYQPKNIQNEIQVKFEEQRRAAEAGQGPFPSSQFQYFFNDSEILLDVAQLAFVYVDVHHSTDAGNLRKFIKDFVSLFFGLDPASFDQAARASGSSEEEEGGNTPNTERGYSPKARPNGTSKGLLRGVLDRSKATSRPSAGSTSRASTPDNNSVINEDNQGPNALVSPPQEEAALENGAAWFRHPDAGNYYREKDVTPDQPYRRSDYNMYCNLSIYIFWRALTILYERLVELKQHEAQVAETVRRAKEYAAPAQNMHMMDRLPKDFFSDTSAGANYYTQVLGMMEEQIKDNSPSEVEEVLRRFYLHIGWKLYSFDKLLGSIVRFASGVINPEGKEKSREIYQLFKQNRSREETTRREEMNYRKHVEKHIKDGEIYRIVFNQGKMRARTSILKSSDPTFDPMKLNAEDRWRAYLSAFELNGPTESISEDSYTWPWAQRGVKRAFENDEEELRQVQYTVIQEEKLTVRIGVEDYKMRFEPDTIEWMSQTKRVKYSGPDGIEEMLNETSGRDETSGEKIVLNNSWMKDQSRDDVVSKTQEFEKVKKADQ